MLIFNVWAIVVGLIILLVYWPIYRFFPGVTNGPHSALVFGLITTVVGGVTEWFGIKGRLFFVPIWLIGVGIVCFQVGTVGIVAFVCIAGSALFWMMKQGKKKEAEAWKKAQSELAHAQLASTGEPTHFWKWVNDALFLPNLMDFTPDICRHDLEILKVVEKFRQRLTPDEVQVFNNLRLFLEKNRDANKAGLLDQKLRDASREVLKRRMEGKEYRLARSRSNSRAAPVPPPLVAPPSLPPQELVPENPLEEILSASKYGGISREQAIQAVLNSEVVILQDKPDEQGETLMIPGSKSAPSLALFTSAKRASRAIQFYPRFKYPKSQPASDTLRRLAPNTEVVVNLGWSVGLQFSQSEVSS